MGQRGEAEKWRKEEAREFGEVVRRARMISQINPLSLSGEIQPPPYVAHEPDFFSEPTTLTGPMATEPISITGLLDSLGAQKYTFLDNVEIKVDQYVRSKGKNCLAIVENKPGRANETHKPAPDEWVPVFICFLLHETYFDHTLDSALSEQANRTHCQRLLPRIPQLTLRRDHHILSQTGD